MSEGKMKFRGVFFLGCLVLFFGVQYGVRRFIEAGGGRIVLENRNEVSSLSRLQSASEQEGDVVILGSSQTERLIPGNGVVCIGVPGSSFQAGLKFLNPALLRTGTVVVIEGDHILAGASGLMKDADGFLFKVGAKVKPLSLASRPSALLVSLIQHLKMRRQYDELQNAVPFDFEFRMEWVERVADDAMDDRISEVVRDIKRIQATGARVMIAVFPKAGAPQGGAVGSGTCEVGSAGLQVLRDVCRVARLAEVPVFDYDNGALEGQLEFQDGVHLVPAAMRTFRFRNTIARDAGEAPQ